MSPQVGGRGFADTEAAKCAIATVAAECRRRCLSRDQTLFLSGSGQAHEGAERLSCWRHFQDCAQFDSGGRRFDLAVLAAGIAQCNARPGSRVPGSVWSVLRVGEHPRTTRCRLQTGKDDRRIKATREPQQHAFVARSERGRTGAQSVAECESRPRWIVQRRLAASDDEWIPEKAPTNHRWLLQRRELDALAATDLSDFVERVELLRHLAAVQPALDEATIDGEPQRAKLYAIGNRRIDDGDAATIRAE